MRSHIRHRFFNARDLIRNPVAVSREPLGIDADLRAHQQPNEQTSKGSRYQPSPALFVDPRAGGRIVTPVEQDGQPREVYSVFMAYDYCAREVDDDDDGLQAVDINEIARRVVL